MKKLKFIVSVFGDRHVNMLLPLLFSIEKHCPEADVSIYWEDITEDMQSTIKRGFPKFYFKNTHFNFTQDITKRISSKTLAWEYAAHQEKGKADWFLFIDADTLVVRNPLSILEKVNADIIITHRNESLFWINSGVLACKNVNGIPDFFTEWRKKTEQILGNPDLFSQANNKTLPYGGADQMSLQQIIDYSRTQNAFTFQNLTCKSVHCAILNETYSRPITENTHIIHYKGGWRDIIFFKGNFTKNRTKKDSWEMYILYVRTFQQAIDSLNKRLGTRYTPQDFRFSIPFYINERTLEERPFLYPLFFVFSWTKRFPQRVLAYIKDCF